MEKENQEIKQSQLNSSKNEWITLIAVILVFAVLTVVLSKGNVGSIIVNGVALALMYVFLAWGMGKFKKAATGTVYLNDCTEDLIRLRETLEELEVEHPGESWEIFRGQEDWEFRCPALQAAIEKMNAESDALSIDDNDGYQCDLADYVNEDLLLTVGNAHFNDFVSNAMTGLGILGTFVGLVIGLWTFDASTTEAMNNSIVPLIDGMKIAFLTSIFGVTFSLLYGSLYRWNMRKAQEALDAFLDTYYASQGRRPENNTMSKLLSYEKSQTDSMGQFAEDISTALSNALQTTLSPTLTELPNQIAKAIEENVLPAINQMKDGFESMSGKMAEQMAQTQSEGVGVIVDKFVTQMDAMVGGQMENLGKSIETICNWQEQTVAHLNEVVSGICSNAEATEKVNTELRSSVDKLDAFLAQITEAQERYHATAQAAEEFMQTTAEQMLDMSVQSTETMNKAAANVERTGNEMAEITERSGEIMKSVDAVAAQISGQEDQMSELLNAQLQDLEASQNAMAQLSQQVQKSCADLLEQMNAACASAAEQLNTSCSAVTAEMKDSCTTVAESAQETCTSAKEQLIASCSTVTEQMKDSCTTVAESAQEVCASAASQLEESAGHMTASAENLNNQWTAVLERSFAQFDKELAVALQHFSGTLADLQEIVERSPGLVDSSISKMQKETSKYLQTMSEYQRQLGQTVSGSVAAVEKHTSAVEKQAAAMERHAASIEKQTRPHTNV